MLTLGILSTFLIFASAIRFNEFIPDGETDFHGIPVDKYVSSMNRIMEITRKLTDINETSLIKFEEIDWNQTESSADYNPFLYQGDVVLSESQLDGLVEDFEIQLAMKEGREVPERLFSIGIDRWTHFPISWSIDYYQPPAGGIEVIQKGFAMWEQETCITFQQGPPRGYGHITVRNIAESCYAELGHQNRVTQFINLGFGCGHVGVAAHEIGHSLGLMHTQTRPDRDHFIRVFTSILKPGTAHNFKTPEAYFRSSTHGLGYDFGSIMHYNRGGFSAFPGLNPLVPLDSLYYNTPGQRVRLSFLDVKEINMIYCKDRCSAQLACQNGGYTDPKDCSKCRCPEGFGGVLCESLATSMPQCGETVLVVNTGYRTLSMQGVGTCYWHISAPQSTNVTITINRLQFFMDMQGTCQGEFLEIKHDSDVAKTGPRFCGYRSRPTVIPASKLSSNIYIIFKSTSPQAAFSLSYRADVLGAPAPTASPVWGPWSQCTKECGGCGIRARQRSDGAVTTEYCNLQPCYNLKYFAPPFCCAPFQYSPYYPSQCIQPYGK